MSISNQLSSILDNAVPNEQFSEQMSRGKEFTDQMRNMGVLKQEQGVVADPHTIGIDKLKRMYASSCAAFYAEPSSKNL